MAEFPVLDSYSEVNQLKSRIAHLELQVQNTRVLPRNIFSSGTLPGTTVLRIGDKNITVDAPNRRILVSDGTNNRVLIGYDEGGF